MVNVIQADEQPGSDMNFTAQRREWHGNHITAHTPSSQQV